MMIKKLNEIIYYFEKCENPLSSEVFLIKGITNNYLFDVGNNDLIIKDLEEIPNKIIILSHFHEDHIGKINSLDFEKGFVSKQTAKYLDLMNGKIKIIDNNLSFIDKEKFTIINFPNSHSKDALALMINDEYLFVGDAIYTTSKLINNKTMNIYNVQKLKEEIELLEKIPAKYVILSHSKKIIYNKTVIVEMLKIHYCKRKKNIPYIEVC